MSDEFWWWATDDVAPTSVEIALGAAVSGPIAPGPRVSVPGEVVPPIAVRLVTRSNPYSVVGTLDQSFGRTWQDQISEPGAGKVQLDNRDPDLDLIDEDTLLRFELNGDAQFIALPVDIEQVTVAPGEEFDQITTISGPGHLAVLGDALVYPSRGVGAVPVEEDRVFSWPSPDFDDSSWGAATELATVDDARTSWPSIPFGDGFPEGSGASVVWAPAPGAIGTSDFTHPEGDCYFRATVDCPTTGRVVVYALIDNWGEIFFDGQPILVVSPSDGFSTVSVFGLDVSVGEHTVAVRGHNAGDDLEAGYNPGGVAIAIYDADINNQPTSSSPFWVTDSSMKLVAYPSTPPGMTPGQVAEILLVEGVERGSLDVPLFLMFDEEVDSNGNPWPEVAEIATKVGTDYLTCFREMSGTYFDMWMAPAGFELYLFSLDGQGVDTSIDWHPPTDENDPTSGNIENLVHQRRQ